MQKLLYLAIFVASCASDDADACRVPEPGRYVYSTETRTLNAVLPFKAEDCVALEGVATYTEGFVNIGEFPLTTQVSAGCTVTEKSVEESSCSASVSGFCKYGTGAGDIYTQEELWFDLTPKSARLFAEIVFKDPVSGGDRCRGTFEATIGRP